MTVYDKESVTFYYDWKNVRLIVIDQYAAYAKGLSNKKFLDWLEKAILSAKNADHVFIAFHEPRFPGLFRSDPFWNLLLKHSGQGQGRALGAYSPLWQAVLFPIRRWRNRVDQTGAAGKTGHSDGMNTFVQIGIDGKNAAFRAVQAPDKTKTFQSYG